MSNLLTTLARLNPTVVFLGTLVVGLVALFLPGAAGALLLLAVIAALVALLSKTWALTPPPLRMARVAILAGLAVIAVLKLLP